MGMKWYVTRRIAWAVVVSVLIVSLTWGLIKLSPNPQVEQAVSNAVLNGQNPEEAREAIEQRRGLDRPLWVQYKDFVLNVYTFNWGWSISRSEPVTQAVLSGLYYTAQYSVPWTLATVIFGPIIGLYAAANQYGWRDHAATAFSFFGFAIPNFFFGIILLLIFGVQLGWTPVIYNTDVAVFGLENVRQLVLPVFVLVTGSIGGTVIVARNESAEYVDADFVKTARAKGVSRYKIFYNHILRPTLVPLSTTIVGQLIALFTGASLLVEVVFGIPGLGLTIFNAILAQDPPLVLGITYVFAFIGVVSNLIQDLVYTVLDPRISFDDR